MLRTALLIGTVALAAACTKKIDSAKGEKLLREKLGIEKNVNVTCPSDITIKAKTKFTCDIADAKPYKVDFTQEDDEGNVTWELEARAFDTNQALAKEQGSAKELKFKCPKQVAVVEKPSESVTCETALGDKKGQVTFTYGPPWSWKLTW